MVSGLFDAFGCGTAQKVKERRERQTKGSSWILFDTEKHENMVVQLKMIEMFQFVIFSPAGILQD